MELIRREKKITFKANTRKLYPSKSYRSHIKNRYDLSVIDYELMFNNQAGCCVICQSKLSIYGTNTHIDHNHSTGEVRGLLCRDCNQGIGLLKENILILENAIEYLKGDFSER